MLELALAMRVILQRVSSASVTIAGRVAGRIERGLLVLVSVEGADTAADGEWLAQKITKLRIFADTEGHMNLSVQDIVGGILVISQFTLHAGMQKGTRPSFHRAGKPEHAKPLYEQFVAQLSAALGRPVVTGEFGAMMQVALVNDGPVTLILDSKQREQAQSSK
jgi:D-tyrosyl-tRNA(Tyr) deacylase